jgi:hypothetical protein
MVHKDMPQGSIRKAPYKFASDHYPITAQVVL